MEAAGARDNPHEHVDPWMHPRRSRQHRGATHSRLSASTSQWAGEEIRVGASEHDDLDVGVDFQCGQENHRSSPIVSGSIRFMGGEIGEDVAVPQSLRTAFRS